MKISVAIVLLAGVTAAHAAPQLKLSANPSPRELYAAGLLRPLLAKLPGDEKVLMATRLDALLKPYDKQVPDFWPDAKEAFVLRRIGNTVIVAGFDPSGVLYGAEELATRIGVAGALPATLDYEDHPQLKLRGVALGLQKPTLTYENAEYDYRYTPEEFPWFYDRAAWTKYLDQLAENRVNSLYLWNGHPFTSLLKLPRYPEAQELPAEQLDKNIAMFQWLTQEADKRGIWVLQGFYNIHLSHNFARAHKLPFHLSKPTGLASDYTRYCISEFIRQYPNVGLFMTLGEAMGPNYGADWLARTIIPGVKDGLAEQEKAVGHPVPEPPIVVRAHATRIEDVMAAARPLYSNIDTMWKWNGESYTWTNIRGPVKERFDLMVKGSNTTIVNMHLLSNLEPFRWGDPDFVRQTVVNFVRIGIGGVHLYPLRYWDWPNSADNTAPLLNQPDRDWIWFASWARYGWNPEREASTEKTYWTQRFAERFTGAPRAESVALNEAFAEGTPKLSDAQLAAGEHLLAAYELSGVCSPTLLPRIGITEGNREVFSLGMTMPQLIDAKRYNPAETLWTGDAPDGERLDEYVANEVAGRKHHGQTPVAVAAMAAASSAKAVTEAEAAAPAISLSMRPEYDRVVNDMRAMAAEFAFYNHKTQAAVLVMRYGYDHDAQHLQEAGKLLAASVDDFAKLTALTDKTYRDAAGMETSQRQIPVRGGPETNHWRDLLPVYQKELATFQQRLKSLGDPSSATSAAPARLPQVAFKLAPGAGETFTVKAGAKLYTDAPTPMATVAPELDGLTGIRVSAQQSDPIHFTLDEPAQILVGFFKSDSKKAMNVSPATEQWNILLPNAVTVAKGLPVTVWTKELPAGVNDLDLGKGAYIVLGFIPTNVHVSPHVNFSTAGANGEPPNLDWLFES